MSGLDCGVIGNGASAALVDREGRIVWCCLPSFDSPSVFAALLDQENGGHFGLSLDDQFETNQEYVAQTNILRTVLRGESGEIEILDCMPRDRTPHETHHYPPEILRAIRVLEGQPRLRVAYSPRLAYGESTTTSENRGEYLKSMTVSGPYESVYLYSSLSLDHVLSGEAIEISGEHFLLLSYNEKLTPPTVEGMREERERTRKYWLAWVAESPTFGRYNDAIVRSSLVLRLLAYQKTGAVVAAVTTSLPEEIGSGRNWDYRYCWLRDASMAIKVFTQIGHYQVGKNFFQFILDVIPYKNEKIQIIYGIRGETNLKEKELAWLKGFEKSGPVRVGNAAYIQKQNDIFGLVLDTIHQRLTALSNSVENIEGLWTVVRALVRHIEDHWQEPDAGIWEIRGGKRHFTFSKMLCWVGVERGIQIAQLLGRTRYVDEWGPLLRNIRDDIMTHGWNDEAQAFTQSYDNSHLDASNLLFEPYGFVSADDPRYISTVNRTYEELCENGLMYRYRNEDDFGKPKSSFTVCSFWMVISLFRIGRRDEAREMFDDLLAHANHLGLFSEDMDFATKRLLGNFPQGYSHLALIDAAITLAGEDNE